MVYTLLFFSSKCSLFHNSNVFGSCIIDKKIRRQKFTIAHADGAARSLLIVAEPSLFTSLPVVRQTHKEADGKLLQKTMVKVLLVQYSSK